MSDERARLSHEQRCRSGAVALALAAACFWLAPNAHADLSPSARLPPWLVAQAVPSVYYYTSARDQALGLEWEAAPVLYSFGMNPKTSPWRFWIIEPVARFTGSIELKVAGQVSFRHLGSSPFSASAELLGYVPLIRRGEYLTFDLGAASYYVADEGQFFFVAGFSTLFGLVHTHVKYSPWAEAWIAALEFRFF